MALFDTKTTEALDDTLPLTAVIEAAENIHGFTKSESWPIRRRYRDFAALNTKLTENTHQFECPLPPKKLFGNLNREFIAKRTQELQVYLNTILSIPYLSLSKDVKMFLDPKNYNQNFADLALQNVSMCMREKQHTTIEKTLPHVGWRIRKTYFLAKSLELPKRERNLIVWVFYGPDFCLDYAEAQVVLDFLCAAKHSLVRTPQLSLCTEKGAVIVKGAYESSGSLRDVLCNAKPERPYLQKYLAPREPNCFDVRQLQLLGRRILEALKFLKEKQIPFCHLHCGNIAVTKDDCVQLLDIENAVLGVSPLYRSFMIQCKAIRTFEDVVVYCFGHTFYEIVTGTPLHVQFLSPDLMPADCPQPFAQVFQSVLSQEATQNALPSLDELLSRDAFLPSWYQTISSCNDAHFKVPSKVKQLLAKCQENFLQRLHQDQAEFRRSVKMKLVEDFMNSEEQKRLRRRAVREATKEAPSIPSAAANEALQPVEAPIPVRVAPLQENIVHKPSAPVAPIAPTAKVVNSSLHEPVSPNSSIQDAADKISANDGDRSALLASIRNFNASRLKKAVTVDKSTPKF